MCVCCAFILLICICIHTYTCICMCQCIHVHFSLIVLPLFHSLPALSRARPHELATSSQVANLASQTTINISIHVECFRNLILCKHLLCETDIESPYAKW